MKAIDKAINKAGTATRLAELLTVSAMTVSHWRNRYQGVVPADRVSQIENAGDLPVHHQRRLQHHINRMWLEKMSVPSIIIAGRSLASAMGEYA
ncbi:MAG: helix-turn-helix domain-containing protein [Enterobacter sp.]|jgi:DNA-binding transcriptional regulator YdaS (Cro superfamily)|nr:helix-turn-helix domain-containing protein [Enterobacter sp.]